MRCVWLMPATCRLKRLDSCELRDLQAMVLARKQLPCKQQSNKAKLQYS